MQYEVNTEKQTKDEREKIKYNQTVYKSEKYHISDLIDIPLLQQLFNSFYELTGITHAVLDSDNNIVSSIGWKDICTSFHRIHPQTEQRCRQSDRYIVEHIQTNRAYIGYKCLNGLMEYATPIVVEDQHLGTIYLGQLLHEAPDEEFFRHQARRFGFEEEAYLEALRKINIVPESRVKSIMEFYSRLGQVLSKMGLEKLNQLEAVKNKFSKTINSFPDPVTISEVNTGIFVDVNDAWVDIIGYKKQEAIGRSPVEMDIYLDPEDRTLFFNKLIAQGYVKNHESVFRIKSGEVRTFLTTANIICIENNKNILGVYKDITERKKAEEEIKYLSFHDQLTGLYNRFFFEGELKRIDNEQQLPISLIMGDVNGLKLVNEALGHSEGDMLLIAVTEILKKSCREEDIIARWGGDEFIILLPECPHCIASQILERIKENYKSNCIFPIETSISLGLATKHYANRDIRDIIKEAEDKMYRHKLLEDLSTRSCFITSLQKALWTRDNETEEHCQRMQEMALKIGRTVGLPDSELDNLKLLATLHDIGKIAIPNSILGKPAKLTSDEWETVKKHAEIGYRIALSSPDMAPIAEGILHHHERWDGTGYPLGLKGENIPFISRIISIADTYDVMLNGRSYQKAVSIEQVKAEILKCAGSQFDPDLAKIAITVLDEALNLVY